MAVVKLTASKQAVQFIDDEGNVFQTSVLWLTQLLNGSNEKGLILLTRLPLKASKDRFLQSPVLGGVAQQGDVRMREDGLSPKVRQDAEQVKAYTDKKVF